MRVQRMVVFKPAKRPFLRDKQPGVAHSRQLSDAKLHLLLILHAQGQLLALPDFNELICF